MASRAKLTLVPKEQPASKTSAPKISAPKKEAKKQEAQAPSHQLQTPTPSSSKILKTTAVIGLTIASIILFRRKIF